MLSNRFLISNDKSGRFTRNAIYFGVGLACAAAAAVFARKRRRQSVFLGKVVVITGGSRGLGLAIAEEFGRRGANLVLAARNAEELLRASQLLLDSGLVASEENIHTVTADLTQQRDAGRLIEEATERFGRIDVLVNNAGIITVGPIESQTVEDFQRVMRANFFSGLHCTMAVLPQMLDRRVGAIANITSIGGKVAVPHLLPYTASKFAAVGFSEGLAAEVRSKGIHVTTVVPGLMRTGSHRNAYFSGDAENEYRWFSFLANLPGMSTSASNAARQIVDGIAVGATEVAITPHAKFASRFANIAPSLRRVILQVANGLLPSSQPGKRGNHCGADVSGREPLPARTLGKAATRRYNQTGQLAG